MNEIKVAKEKCYGVKEPINIWDGNVDNIAISYLKISWNKNKF